MNKKTSYIIIFSLLVVLTVGIIFTDYIKQLGTILADASVPNPGHSLSEIEGGQDLATKEYVDSVSGAIPLGRTSGDTGTGYLLYAGTTRTAGRLYGGTTAPSGTTRLNYDGYLYATRLYDGGTRVAISTRNIGTGDGLSGGGDLTANRTLTVDSTVIRTSGDQTIGGTKTFSSPVVVAAPTGPTHAATKGYVDSTIGEAIAGITQGSVTSVGTGDGLTGGPITSSGTISVDSTVVRTTGDQTIGGTKTFSNAIVGTGIITNTSGGIRPACNASTRGLIWNEYGSSGQRDKLYICQKLSNNTYSFTFISEPACGYAFIDPRDSNSYPTVQIGDQCWMAKNLAYLPSVVGPGTGSETTPYYYVYGYDGTDVSAAKVNSNYTTYGVLYNWPAATTACPSGWHLPTDAEWNVLETYTVSVINSPNPQYPCSTSEYGWRRCADDSGTDAGGTYGAGKSLKKVGQGKGVGAGDDLVGFSALLAGARDTDGSFYNLGWYAYFRSSSASSSSYAWRRHLYANYSTVNRDYSNKAGGFSVRCLRDWTI